MFTTSSCPHPAQWQVLPKGSHEILHRPKQENGLLGIPVAVLYYVQIVSHPQVTQWDDMFYLKVFLSPEKVIKQYCCLLCYDFSIHIYVWTYDTCVWVPLKPSRECLSLTRGVISTCEQTEWVLRTKLQSSARAANTVKHWAIPSARVIFNVGETEQC